MVDKQKIKRGQKEKPKGNDNQNAQIIHVTVVVLRRYGMVMVHMINDVF